MFGTSYWPGLASYGLAWPPMAWPGLAHSFGLPTVPGAVLCALSLIAAVVLPEAPEGGVEALWEQVKRGVLELGVGQSQVFLAAQANTCFDQVFTRVFY